VVNHAAFAPEDTEDARRGRPAVDLQPYAAQRGLVHQGQVLVGHFSGLNPLWADYVFNSMRGELAPQRFGTLQHELYEIGLGDDGQPTAPGTFYGKRTTFKQGLRSFMGVSRTVKNEPFGNRAMWLPVTGVKLLVPEAALLPRVRILNKGHLSSLIDPKLGDAAPGFRMIRDSWVPSELREALGERMGPALSTLDARFVRVDLACGALGLQVNGFVADPARLDALVQVGVALAEAAAELGRPGWRPAPFEQPLGPFDASQHPPGYQSFEGWIDQSGMAALADHGAQLGLTIEDPVALHRSQPRLPLPGTSRGVLSGTLPGASRLGRLTWQYQAHPGSGRYLRGGAVFAASPSADLTPPGGVLLPETDMYVAARDGIACCWSRTLTEGTLEAAGLAQRAVASMRASGLADV
jgi:hypothetical protein